METNNSVEEAEVKENLVVKLPESNCCSRCCNLNRTRFLTKSTLNIVQASILVTVIIVLVLSCILLDKFNGKPRGHDENYHRNLVDEINSANLTWKAVYNKFASQKVPLTGSPNEAESKAYQSLHDQEIGTDSNLHAEELDSATVVLPKAFDARLKWPFCPSIHSVPNQGGCGSCWAVAATTVMSDRICIHSNGKLQPTVSLEDVISCCEHCMGCGGELIAINAFQYWKKTGVVTGGGYGSGEGCRPYSISSECGSPCGPQNYASSKTPKCTRSCQPNYYHRTYDNDKYYASEIYWVSMMPMGMYGSTTDVLHVMHEGDSRIERIQKEIYFNGPVEACFPMMDDFQHYSSGIYKRLSKYDRLNTLELWFKVAVYGHCVRVIGWGQDDNGERFWIMVNSWGRDWGEYGLFRLSFDDTPAEIVAGLPKFDNQSFLAN